MVLGLRPLKQVASKLDKLLKGKAYLLKKSKRWTLNRSNITKMLVIISIVKTRIKIDIPADAELQIIDLLERTQDLPS